tara:strand:- start:43 stop:594 length:552 start_codon:yes stop_codon:yes gene_type:complete
MKKRLVIFSGSNKLIDDQTLFKNLEDIGKNLDVNKFEVWYGGGNSGIMGIIPKKFSEKDGAVYSVDARQFVEKFPNDKIFGTRYVMETFNERQNGLVEKGDLYLCLPGGVGTVSELFDVLVNNDVNGKNLKILLYSYNNFFDDIIHFITVNIKEGYIRKHILDNIFVFNNSKDIIDFLDYLDD